MWVIWKICRALVGVPGLGSIFSWFVALAPMLPLVIWGIWFGGSSGGVTTIKTVVVVLTWAATLWWNIALITKANVRISFPLIPFGILNVPMVYVIAFLPVISLLGYLGWF